MRRGRVCNFWEIQLTTYRSLHIAAHSRNVVVTSWTSGSSVGITVSFCLKEQWSSTKQKQHNKWRSFPTISLVWETIGCLTAFSSVFHAYYGLLRTLSHSDPFMPMKTNYQHQSSKEPLWNPSWALLTIPITLTYSQQTNTHSCVLYSWIVLENPFQTTKSPIRLAMGCWGANLF